MSSKKPRKKQYYMLMQSSWPFGSDTYYGEKLGDVKKKLRSNDYIMFKVHDGEIRRINLAGGIRG